MYGSSFIIATDSPRLFSRRPIEATAIPLPTDEATPPVTNKYFAMCYSPEIAYTGSSACRAMTHRTLPNDFQSTGHPVTYFIWSLSAPKRRGQDPRRGPSPSLSLPSISQDQHLCLSW